MPNPNTVPGLWTTAKAHLATFQTDLSTVVNDLANLESDRDALENAGAADISDWLRVQVEAARAGFQPRVSTGSGRALPAQVRELQAPNPNVARDTTSVDTRPVTSTPSAQLLNLS